MANRPGFRGLLGAPGRGPVWLAVGLAAALAAGCAAPVTEPAPPPGTSSAPTPSPSPVSITGTTATTASTETTGAADPTSSSPAPGPRPTPITTPPFVERVRWVTASGGRSLRVYPTAAGRAGGAADADAAWAEVLRLAPDADRPGMRAQFDCHWVYARLVDPDKTSWNLEPWRPVVSQQAMVDSRCNPGAPESAET